MSIFTPFFTTKNNIAIALFDGEKIIVIKQDFPNANTDRIKFLADSGITVLTHSPIQNLATLSVERVFKPIYFPYSDGTNGRYILSEKIVTPQFIGKETEMLNLCKSYYCMNLDYRMGEKNIAELKEYTLTYNCIGWAFGIHDWINPILSTVDTSNVALLENKIKGFLSFNSKVYQMAEKKDFIVYEIIKNIKTVSCDNNLLTSDIIRQDGAIAFYFKNNTMTHATRYVSIFEDQQINAWTSKLGQNIMVTHELVDLSGTSSLYGEPLCYGLPEFSNKTHFSTITNIVGEINAL